MSTPSTFRTDRNNNPTAFITLMAKEAGLVLGTDYEVGDPFTVDGTIYNTAKLLGDPLALTIDVINALGFRTAANSQRWAYISIPKFLWNNLPASSVRASVFRSKCDVIGAMYKFEGGTAMRSLFPNYDLYSIS
jgi:hypothetical protein